MTSGYASNPSRLPALLAAYRKYGSLADGCPVVANHRCNSGEVVESTKNGTPTATPIVAPSWTKTRSEESWSSGRMDAATGTGEPDAATATLKTTTTAVSRSRWKTACLRTPSLPVLRCA